MLDQKVETSKSKIIGSLDSSPRVLIQGDNNVVLESISEQISEKIKCIYIDPPYNNGEKYHHYSDNEQHESWLAQIKKTLVSLRPTLRRDGSIWISIDDSEMHYLKVAADEVFGRHNFISTIVWQQRTTRENRSVLSRNHEFVLVYAKDKKSFENSRNLEPLTKEVLARYKNPDNDKRGPWQSVSANVQDGHAVKSQFYDLKAPNGKIHQPPNGRCWVYNKERMENEIAEGNIWFGADGNGVPRIKKFLNGTKKGLTPETLWLADVSGTNKSAKKHIIKLFPEDKIFDTPKPEQLIRQILNIATNEGDIVLDCYLGSGSTVSTAHKMNRNYIGIEVGNHIADLVVERLKKVVSGEDDGGITAEVGWQGGGDFKYFKI